MKTWWTGEQVSRIIEKLYINGFLDTKKEAWKKGAPIMFFFSCMTGWLFKKTSQITSTGISVNVELPFRKNMFYTYITYLFPPISIIVFVYCSVCYWWKIGDKKNENPDGKLVCMLHTKRCDKSQLVSSVHNSTSFSEIDECLENNGGCSHSCINTPGAYRCSCPDPELSLGPDNRSCEG